MRLELTLGIDRVDTGTMSQILLVVSLQPRSSGVVLVVLDLGLDRVGNKWCSVDVVSLLWHGDVNLVGDHFDSGSLELLLDSVGEESITRDISDIHDSFFRVGGSLDYSDGLVGDDGVNVSSVLGGKLG